jgi:hypothetical protein
VSTVEQELAEMILPERVTQPLVDAVIEPVIKALRTLTADDVRDVADAIGSQSANALRDAREAAEHLLTHHAGLSRKVEVRTIRAVEVLVSRKGVQGLPEFDRDLARTATENLILGLVVHYVLGHETDDARVLTYPFADITGAYARDDVTGELRAVAA